MRSDQFVQLHNKSGNCDLGNGVRRQFAPPQAIGWSGRYGSFSPDKSGIASGSFPVCPMGHSLWWITLRSAMNSSVQMEHPAELRSRRLVYIWDLSRLRVEGDV